MSSPLSGTKVEMIQAFSLKFFLVGAGVFPVIPTLRGRNVRYSNLGILLGTLFLGDSEV